jgi:hypothetical protein
VLDIPDLTAFESDAHKAVSVVMWYQQWSNSGGYQYFQSGWMNEARNHGSIPLVTWDPWDPAQVINQPAFALQNIINGNLMPTFPNGHRLPKRGDTPTSYVLLTR